jgi:glyoxylase-like metal-dependent hydrolase (beta-lactamase superfamily II)
MEELYPNLFRIQIPLPKSPLKYLNSYLIKGDGRNLLIDTGMNQAECRDEMFSSLKKLQVDLTKTDFFITHMHSDHIGLLSSLLTDTSTAYLGREEAPLCNEANMKALRRQVDKFYQDNGFPPDEYEKSLAKHPGRRYGFQGQIDFQTRNEGDTVEIGDYHFTCIETPGHSTGHLCLYEADKEILVSGDHILFDITPNITYWPTMENSLKEYLDSLEKVYPLSVKMVLPGHRRIMDNHQQRIREIQGHHRDRLNEILAALADGEKSVFDIVPHITWDVKYDASGAFPPSQKWFAFGETISHIKYLEAEAKIQKKTRGDKVVYSLS